MTSSKAAIPAAKATGKAAEYVAKEFERAGLKPAGTDGYPPARAADVPRDRRDPLEPGAGPRGRATEPLALGQDAIISSRVDPSPTVEAEVVFAGYGLTIPEAHHDDFAGLDVRGKLVVLLAGAPASISGPLAAHMQSAGERAALLKRVGAIGMVSIPNPKHMDIPWERASLARFMPSMSLADPALDEARGPEAGRHDQPGPCRQAARRLGPHVRARSSPRPMPTSPCRTSRSRRG